MSKANVFNLGSFNVRGLSSDLKKELLSRDLERLKIDVCCLQETKIRNGEDINIRNDRLICFTSDCQYYGNGFLISSKWRENIFKCWRVSDRICVLQLKLKPDEYTSELNGMKLLINKKKCYKSEVNDLQMKITRHAKQIMTIINVYAQTTQRIKKDSTELDDMYVELAELVNEFNSQSAIMFIAGDFNAKVGKKSNIPTPCLGRYSRGRRNASGESLIEFCNINDLFVSNSAFQHRASHITTWESKITINNRIINVYNQIDYIICRNKQKHTLIDSRSYSNTLVNSDHRIVVTRMGVDTYKIFLNKKKYNKNSSYDSHQLIINEKVRSSYQNQMRQNLRIIENNKWEEIQQTIRDTAEVTIGFTKTTKNPNRLYNEAVKKLSTKQKNLRLEICNCNNIEHS